MTVYLGCKRLSIHKQYLKRQNRRGGFLTASIRVRSNEGLLGHDVVEIIRGNCCVSVRVGAVNHLLKFLVSHSLTELACDTTQVSDGDGTCAIIVEESENFVDILAGVPVAHTGGHHIEELLEIDVVVLIFVEVSNHLVDGLVLSLEAKGLHGGAELTGVDGTTAVGIEKIEGLLDLLNLILGKAGAEILVSLEFGSTGSHCVSFV